MFNIRCTLRNRKINQHIHFMNELISINSQHQSSLIENNISYIDSKTSQKKTQESNNKKTVIKRTNILDQNIFKFLKNCSKNMKFHKIRFKITKHASKTYFPTHNLSHLKAHLISKKREKFSFPTTTDENITTLNQTFKL